MKHALTRRIGASALVGAFTLTMAAVPGSAAACADEESEGRFGAPGRSSLEISGERRLAEWPARSDTKAPGLLVSAQAQVQRIASSAKRVKVASAQEGTTGYDDPGAFFRTKRGVALLVLAGAGIGYMWYSKVHDRIHSERRAQSND